MKKAYPSKGEAPRAIGGVEIAKVVREFIPLIGCNDANGTSIGAFIDQHIADCIAKHEELNEVKLMFDPEQWQTLVEYYKQVTDEAY